MRKLLRWTFTVGVGIAPLVSAQASEPSASPPTKTRGFSYLVDAEVCPHPEEGLFEPASFDALDLVVRNALLPESDLGTILQVVVEPSFATPFSMSLQKTPAGEKYQLRLVRGKKNLWGEMMQEMQRQQGSVVTLGEVEQRRALEKLSTATETLTVAADGDLANQLVALWTGVLARTQYANEVLTAPDGSGIGMVSLDGTTYHFWHARRSASTHSPRRGTLLHDVVGVTEDLLAYVEAPKDRQVAVEVMVKTRIALVLKRIKKNEPCLRAEPWVASPEKHQLSTDVYADEIATDVRALFGDRGVRAIADATFVEVARLQRTRASRTYSIGHAYVVRPELGQELARQILDPHTYPVRDPSPCEKGPCGEGTIKLCGGFDPGVVVRFHGPRGGMVDALLCFNCDDLGAVPRPSNRTPLERQSKYVVPRNVDKADMEPGALDLLRLVDPRRPRPPEGLAACREPRR